jgi:HSP20 family protein
MNRLQGEMNDLFRRFDVGDLRRRLVGKVYPAFDMWQDEDSLYVEAELPGMELDDLEIYVTGGNQLSVKGERKQPSIKDGTWHRQERGFGPFSRVIALPMDVDADRVVANLVHGVLTITLPKREEAKPRKITVKTA